MNTITTKKPAAKSSSEFIVMLLICAIGIFGAISLASPSQQDSSWLDGHHATQDVLSDQDRQNETIVLD